MKQRLLSLLVGLAVLPLSAGAVEVVKNDQGSLNVDGRLQVLGFGQYLDDLHRSDARIYMFMKQARLGATGEYNDFKFRTSLAFGGEEITASSGVALGLLDMYVDAPVGPLRLRAGQFKIPYSRERLTDSGTLLFGDRSVQNLGFRFGRDVGVVAHGDAGPIQGALGIFVGGGRDVPERYLPQRMGSPVVSLRLGFNQGMSENVFAETGREVAPVQPRFAVHLNGMFLKDSLVGHSSVLNVRLGERSLLTSSAWNPYVGQAPMVQGTLYQFGGDVVFENPIGEATLRLEGEINHGQYENTYGKVSMTGGRAEVSYQAKAFSVGVRYAMLKPDANMANGGRQITGGRPFSEVTPAITYRFTDNVKVVADMPFLIAAPVINETGNGAYVLTEQPDQTSLLRTQATSSVVRQNILEGRMLLQANF